MSREMTCQRGRKPLIPGESKFKSAFEHAWIEDERKSPPLELGFAPSTLQGNPCMPMHPTHTHALTHARTQTHSVLTSLFVAQMGLSVNLVLLVDRQSMIGPIEASTGSSLDSIRSTHFRLIIIVAVVDVAVLAFALLFSWKLTQPLSQLAFGMDMLVCVSWF